MIAFRPGKLALVATLITAAAMCSSPASAQSPVPQSCSVSFASVPTNGMQRFSCGVVQLQLWKIVETTCGNGLGPFGAPYSWFSVGGGVFCNQLIDNRMRAYHTQPVGVAVYSAQAFSVNPGTCNLAVRPSWSNWCSIGRAPPQTVVMVSVAGAAR
jgi:hypothetical protein